MGKEKSDRVLETLEVSLPLLPPLVSLPLLPLLVSLPLLPPLVFRVSLPSKGVFDGVLGSQAKIVTQKKNITSLQNQKNTISFSNLDEHEFSTFSFSSHSGNGQKIADFLFPSC